jgi:hypothetical protein
MTLNPVLRHSVLPALGILLLFAATAVAPTQNIEVRIGRVEFLDDCDTGPTKDCEPLVRVGGTTRNCNGQSAGGDGIIEDCQEVVVREKSSFILQLDEDDVFSDDPVDISEDGADDVYVDIQPASWSTLGTNGTNNDCLNQVYSSQANWCVLDDQDPGSPDRGRVYIKIYLV